MSTVADSLVEEITLDLSQACLDRHHALLQRSEKDTPGHRALVAETSAMIDSLLDMYLETRGPG